jgi:hypothetical protein
MSQRLPSWRSTSCLPSHAGDGGGFGALLGIVLGGSGHADIDLAKLSHDTCLLSMQGMKGDMRAAGATGEDILTIALKALFLQKAHSSFHVRETVLLCAFTLMTENYPCLTPVELKALKDLFADGLHDIKPEVVALAKAGMVSYLSLKTPLELQTLADAYIKNSDILANRESKKRKLDKAAPSSKPDKMHTTTVLMMSCLILSLPYDMPLFMPALVSSLVRHVTIPSLKDAVTKTIQDFKRTHQDRWESDFKQAFSREQLEDLQGTGAAHYYS